MKNVAFTPPWAPVVATWHERADAYLELTRRWPLSERLADRLISHLPDDFSGLVADLGAGTGVVTKRLLAARPGARVLVLEPADRMIAIAKAELAGLGDRVAGFDDLAVGDLEPPLAFDAAVSSATMHLVRDEHAFTAVTRCLRPGGVFAYNIWGHSFDETANAPDPTKAVRAAFDAALAERNIQSPQWRDPKPPRQRTRDEIKRTGDGHGFDVDILIDVDHVPLAFYVEFTAMAPGVLHRLPPQVRAAVVQRAGELVVGEIPVPSVRVVAKKRA